MRKILVLLLTLGVLLGACESGDMEMPADAGTSGTVFKLGRDPFENMSTTRSANEEKLATIVWSIIFWMNQENLSKG